MSSPTSNPRERGSLDASIEHPAAAARSAAHSAESNLLLRSLPAEDYNALLPLLIPVRLRQHMPLVEPHVRIDEVYFVREGVGSMLATEQEGGVIEVGTIGNEGFVGLPLLLGGESMPTRVVVQVDGDAWRLDAASFRAHLAGQGSSLRRACERYALFFIETLAQSVACNRLHMLEERCARWLLVTRDRVHDDTFELTHEFLAAMIGVRRSGVTVAMGTLQSAGILRYQRGRITIVDRARLEEVACDCYRIGRQGLDALVSDVAPGEATSH